MFFCKNNFHLKKTNRTSGVVVLLCFLFACSCGKSPLAKYGKTFEQVMKSDSCLFRGFNLGASLEKIKANEPSGLKEEDNSDGTNYLFYELKADSSTNYTV